MGDRTPRGSRVCGEAEDIYCNKAHNPEGYENYVRLKDVLEAAERCDDVVRKAGAQYLCWLVGRPDGRTNVITVYVYGYLPDKPPWAEPKRDMKSQ